MKAGRRADWLFGGQVGVDEATSLALEFGFIFESCVQDVQVVDAAALIHIHYVPVVARDQWFETCQRETAKLVRNSLKAFL